MFADKLIQYLRSHGRKIIGLFAVALIILALLRHVGSEAQVPLAAPSAIVVKADIAQIVQATGQLHPRLKVDIGAQVSGQVRQLHVRLGEAIKAGALLVSLDSDTGRNAVQQAEAALAQQVATARRARIELDAARREAERQQRLLAGDATTPFDKEKADTDLARLEAEQQIQDAILAQKRADLVDRQLKLTFTRVSAPIDGEVVSIAVQEGQTVNAIQAAPTLLTLAQLETMTVKARITEAEIGLVRTGQLGRVTTLATNARRYEGKVRVIQPIPERIGNALFYNVLLEVDNADHRLLSDMTVQVELEVARASQAPALNVFALASRDNRGLYTVQVLGADGVATPRRVRVGIRDATHAQILEGLAPGERVLLAPPGDVMAPAP